MFPGFEEWDVPVDRGVTLHGRSGGTGPPIVLLHGHPRAHTTWYRVAPLLVDGGLSVVCPDLRGYGRSSKPEPDVEHAVYCDRAMAQDVVALMGELGHERFVVAGHDRGQGVAYRMALDHADRVAALAVLDGIPLVESVERTDARFATEWWHWFFFAGSPHAERVINADVEAWYGLDDVRRAAMGPDNFDYVSEALHDPATVRAMLEDYRAGLGIDRAHDEEDRRAGRRVACPMLLLWARRDDLEDLHGDPLAIWRAWAPELSGRGLDCGHHMAEEAPEELAGELLAFLRG